MNSIAFRETFSFLRRFVPNGKWCRNEQYGPSGKHCMLGMLAEARRNRADLGWTKGGELEVLYSLLDRTIPTDELTELRRFRVGDKVNDGFIRGFANRTQRIASYNNTRASEDEITAWLDRAADLAYKEAAAAPSA